ncbi:MAG: UDP-4-amino-4,6-dideoxy-N-acetyl-beta-L-altrosamine transaminase [Pseudomonadota bacterium]
MSGPIPYGRQSISEEDIAAVVEVLRSDYLTTGPAVDAFEADLARVAGTTHAVAVSNGTAALHAALFALDIGPGDEVIVPPITFVATVNAVLYVGGSPVFADVCADTLLLDPQQVEARITPRTRAIIGVDYAGQPCDWGRLREIADRHGLSLVADACHALGARYQGRPVGSLADLTVFSFHPVKHITTGEGGAITTDDDAMAARMRMFRSHGISATVKDRDQQVTWEYSQVVLGYNYRITDLQCALGRSQLTRLEKWVETRRALAGAYDQDFASMPSVEPLAALPDRDHAYHLYMVRLKDLPVGRDRGSVFRDLRGQGIGVNVHYIPVHLQPYHRERLGTGPGLCPVAEAAYGELLTLPIFPELTSNQRTRVVDAVRRAISES